MQKYLYFANAHWCGLVINPKNSLVIRIKFWKEYRGKRNNTWKCWTTNEAELVRGEQLDPNRTQGSNLTWEDPFRMIVTEAGNFNFRCRSSSLNNLKEWTWERRTTKSQSAKWITTHPFFYGTGADCQVGWKRKKIKQPLGLELMTSRP